MITRRQLLTSAALTTTAACVSKPLRPNILFVVADDQSWVHSGAYGNRHVQTPTFDRVAKEGVLFQNSFCASPSCTPSRSAILSGRHVWQQKEAGVLYGSIPRDMPLYPHLLEDTGYFTGYTGKGWGPGDWKAQGLDRNPCGREFSERKYGSVAPGIDPRDYAANFSDFLKAKPSGRPFAFWFGSTEPHRLYDTGGAVRNGRKLLDIDVPPFLPDAPEVRSDLLDYAAEIEYFDRQLARMLEVLDRSGQSDNTLVVVTSDNGMPFPRAKTTLYDWGVRMPLAIRWPERIVKPGRVIDDLVSHVDFAPTFLEAAGIIPPTGIAGRSLIPLLTSSQGDTSRDAVFTAMERHTMCRPNGQTYPMRSIRTRDYLYIRNYAPDRWPTGGEFLSSNKTTHGDIDWGPTKDFLLKEPAKYPLCLGRRPAEELYDVKADPGQVRNIASEQPQQTADLRARLENYLTETGDPRMQGLDPWQGYTYHQTVGYGASFNTSLPQGLRDEAAGRATHKPE